MAILRNSRGNISSAAGSAPKVTNPDAFPGERRP